jgi:hypothetical protein
LAVEFVKPYIELLEEIADGMRPADVEEVRLSHGHSPLAALEASVRSSPLVCYVAVDDGRPLCAFGVGGRPLAVKGSPWLLGHERLGDYRRELARLSRPMVQMMSARFSLLENWVHADNVVSVRWLKACGFTLEPAAPFGAQGAMFHRFWMKGGL